MSVQNQQWVDSFNGPSGEPSHVAAGNAGRVGAELGHQPPSQGHNQSFHLFAEQQRMYDFTVGQRNGNQS